MNISIVSHDKKKKDMLSWVLQHKDKLTNHTIYSTHSTGTILKDNGFNVVCLKSGPKGGDQQIGALIANEEIDVLFFFIDPLTTQGHHYDIQALRRICDLYDVPLSTNFGTADLLINSGLFTIADI